MGALLADRRRHQTTPRPRQDRPLKKYHFLIKNVDFSLEKCRFGAHRGVLHYVLRRQRAIFRNNYNFELEICVKARGGRAARCMGSVPVAEMLASEARHDLPTARQGTSVARTTTPLTAFSRAIDRESLAGLCNSLKLLLIIILLPRLLLLLLLPLLLLRLLLKSRMRTI